MVSRNKRIVAAFAAVAAMGMGLAGCGSDTAGDTKTTDDGGAVNITYMHRLPDSEGMTSLPSGISSIRIFRSRPPSSMVRPLT